MLPDSFLLCFSFPIVAWYGITWCPLELSGAVEDLKYRGINIIDSYTTPRILPDAVALVSIITLLRAMCYGVACFRAGKKAKSNVLRQENESPREIHEQNADEDTVARNHSRHTIISIPEYECASSTSSENVSNSKANINDNFVQ